MIEETYTLDHVRTQINAELDYQTGGLSDLALLKYPHSTSKADGAWRTCRSGIQQKLWSVNHINDLKGITDYLF